MVNQEIREEISKYRIRHWEIANKLGVSVSTFSRWIRLELDEQHKELVKEAIESIKKDIL